MLGKIFKKFDRESNPDGFEKIEAWYYAQLRKHMKDLNAEIDPSMVEHFRAVPARDLQPGNGEVGVDAEALLDSKEVVVSLGSDDFLTFIQRIAAGTSEEYYSRLFPDMEDAQTVRDTIGLGVEVIHRDENKEDDPPYIRHTMHSVDEETGQVNFIPNKQIEGVGYIDDVGPHTAGREIIGEFETPRRQEQASTYTPLSATDSITPENHRKLYVVMPEDMTEGILRHDW